MSERILVFGGSFDPPHVGHLIIARDVAERAGFGRVLLMPSASPPHKAGTVATGAQRVAMLEAAIEGDRRFEVCTLELNRQGPSYTFESIMQLRQQYGWQRHLCWLIGADMLRSLPSWHRAAEVVDSATLLTARRGGEADFEAIFDELSSQFSPAQLEKLQKGLIPTRRVELSSSEVRQRLQDALSIRFMVPEGVDRYIREQNLYRCDGDS